MRVMDQLPAINLNLIEFSGASKGFARYGKHKASDFAASTPTSVCLSFMVSKAHRINDNWEVMLTTAFSLQGQLFTGMLRWDWVSCWSKIQSQHTYVVPPVNEEEEG